MNTSLYFGTAPATQAMMADVEAFSASPEPILLTGETGTGKSVLARIIHERSGRPGRLVATSAPQLHDLSQPQLVGHCRGAFTGADRDQQGLLLHANGGTLFIDEMCHAGADLQRLLLLMLTLQEVTPLGSSRAIPVRFRVITAANRPLDTADFLPELLARLDTLVIRVPPLRERREDIPELARVLLRGIAEAHKAAAPRLSRGAIRALTAAEWRTNIRGLRKTLVQGYLRARGSNELHADDLVTAHSPARLHERPFRKYRNPPSADLIARTRDECNGDLQLAARKLNYTPNHLRTLLNKANSAAG